ncbi:MAG: hypothetical protein V3V61_01400 [Gammaproteobacteria bacterium]
MTIKDWLLLAGSLIVAFLTAFATISYQAGSYTRQIDNNVENITYNKKRIETISDKLSELTGLVKGLARSSAYREGAKKEGLSSEQIDEGEQALQTMSRSEAIMFLEVEQGFSKMQAEDIYDADESLKKTKKIR